MTNQRDLNYRIRVKIEELDSALAPYNIELSKIFTYNDMMKAKIALLESLIKSD